MVDTTEIAATAGGVGVGLGSTLLIRQQFDQGGETSVLRPSVLWGVGTGGTALVAPMLMGGRQRGAPWQFVEDYGMMALGTGVFSAFSPKGAGVQLPSV